MNVLLLFMTIPLPFSDTVLCSTLSSPLFSEAFVTSWKAAAAADPESLEALQGALNLAKLDIAKGRFAKAFEVVGAIPVSPVGAVPAGSTSPSEHALLLSQLWVLKGAEDQLKANLDAATKAYQTALALDRDNFEASLKLGSIYMEINQLGEVRTDDTNTDITAYL
jgi:tetratricopeptide (TPR) repeat protein